MEYKSAVSEYSVAPGSFIILQLRLEVMFFLLSSEKTLLQIVQNLFSIIIYVQILVLGEYII